MVGNTHDKNRRTDKNIHIDIDTLADNRKYTKKTYRCRNKIKKYKYTETQKIRILYIDINIHIVRDIRNGHMKCTYIDNIYNTRRHNTNKGANTQVDIDNTNNKLRHKNRHTRISHRYKMQIDIKN